MRTDLEPKDAVREMTPLRIMLTSPSTGGKTYSALRLATGIQKCCPGPIVLIDTENKRGLLYAEDFRYKHIHFPPPHSAADFQEAIARACALSPSVIIVDSMSDEHEGEGGLLEFQLKEVDRLMKAWRVSTRGKVLQAAWIVPKTVRKTLIREIRKINSHMIFCFRAGDKTEWAKKNKGKADPAGEQAEEGNETAIHQGWMPIAGREWIYEMTFALVFGPQADGKPTINPELLSAAQRLVFKINKPFDKFFRDGQQLNEEVGERIAGWCTQGKALPGNWSQTEKLSAPSGSPQPETGPDKSEPCQECKANPPMCKFCHMEMLFRPETFAYKSTTEIKLAGWYCPQKCKDPKDKRFVSAIKAVEHHAILMHQLKQESAAPSNLPKTKAAEQWPDEGPLPPSPATIHTREPGDDE